MKVLPVASPHAMTSAQSTGPNLDARARAIARLQGTPGQAQATPVQNPSNISVEELGAIGQGTEIVDKNAEELVEVVAETAPVEPKAEETPESRRWAQLSRQERALRAKAQQQDAAFKAREDALKAREAELTTKSQVNMDEYIPKARLRQDALGVLEAEGIATYDDLTQRAISRQPVDPQLQAHIQKLEAKIASLEEYSKSAETKAQEGQQAQYQAALRQIELDTTQLIKADPINFEAISKMGKSAVKEVVKLIEDTYNKDGVLMTVEDAATEVENYLIEENYKMASSIQKIKDRLSKASATSTKADAKTQATQEQKQTERAPMKTLTNATASTRKLSARERALLAFKGELKS